MDTVRWGIVGAGRIANTFARDMPSTKSGVLHAVAARSGDSAQEFAACHDVHTAYEGYGPLYADPDIDAIYIATPHNLHLQHASYALRAGKAVLCEKPITTSADECQALIEVARESGSYLMEAMWTWFLPAIREAKRWVDAGRIGRIVQIKADFGYPFEYSPTRREYNAKLAGGCLLEMGVYPVALAALFSGQDPQEISVVSRHAPNGVEDDVAAIFNYRDFVATLGTSFRAKLQNAAYIVGDEAYVAIPNFFRANECQLWVLDEMVDRFDDGRTSRGFDYQIEAVNQDLIGLRKESAIMPLSESLRVQRHMDEMRKQFHATAQ